MVRIDISNRALFVYGVLIVLFLGIGFGVAYGGDDPTVMGHSAGEIEGASVSCNCNGFYTPIFPGQFAFFCSDGNLASVSGALWSVDSCETAHPKGYHCRIDTGISGFYDLSCWTTSENHGEWMGSILNKVDGVTLGSSVVINYLSSTGEWELTTVGKANNHNNPRWNTKTCKAGGYA